MNIIISESALARRLFELGRRCAFVDALLAQLWCLSIGGDLDSPAGSIGASRGPYPSGKFNWSVSLQEPAFVGHGWPCICLPERKDPFVRHPAKRKVCGSTSNFSKSLLLPPERPDHPVGTQPALRVCLARDVWNLRVEEISSETRSPARLVLGAVRSWTVPSTRPVQSLTRRGRGPPVA